MLSKQNWEHLHLMLKSVSTEFVILNGKFCLYILCIVIVKTKNWEVKQRKAVKKKSRKFATKASINLIGKRKKEFSFCLCLIKCSDQIRQSKSNRLRFCFFFPSNSLTLYEMAKISRTYKAKAFVGNTNLKGLYVPLLRELKFFHFFVGGLYFCLNKSRDIPTKGSWAPLIKKPWLLWVKQTTLQVLRPLQVST